MGFINKFTYHRICLQGQPIKSMLVVSCIRCKMHTITLKTTDFLSNCFCVYLWTIMTENPHEAFSNSISFPHHFILNSKSTLYDKIHNNWFVNSTDADCWIVNLFYHNNALDPRQWFQHSKNNAFRQADM